MASIPPGYEYDIFISYRQNDNKYDGWVTEFVDNLQKELDATLKNPVSIYFDENPHDGLQDTHVVGESLKKKLKCLIFIPIISQTYCDESSFAWQHEFLAFNEIASTDELGMNITLANGNVASRILPVRIHEIDAEDQQVIEQTTGSPLRSIDFIYKEAGVNRCLKPTDDKKDNLNNTSYRNQMNKVAHALKDLGSAIVGQSEIKSVKVSSNVSPVLKAESRSSNKGVYIGLAAILLMVLGYFGYTNYFSSDEKEVTALLIEDKTIAVLPFSNTKPDPDTDFLGFAIANQIIGDLDYNKNVIVRPASSVRQYDQEVIDAITVADDLKVNYVLTGTYLMQADIIRLNIELIEVNSENMIWRDEIQVDYNNAFELQDIVAKKVVTGLQVQFTDSELMRIGKDSPRNSLAYEHYMRAVSYPLSNAGDQLAIEMLDKSVALDSNYAPAYYQLGIRTQRITQFGMRDSDDVNLAEEYYLKALSINSELIGVIGDLATLYTEIGRTDEAIKLGRQMLEINSNNATAHFSLSYTYRYAGMIEESYSEMKKALALDAKNPRFRRLGLTGLYVGDIEQAYANYDLDPGSAYALTGQGRDLFRQGKMKEALEHFDRVIAMEPEVLWILVTTVLKSCILNEPEKGLQALKLLEQANPPDGEALYLYAGYAALLGDKERSLRLLEKAVNLGYFNYPFMLKDSFMKSIRGEDGFQELLLEAQAKHEAFKEKFF